MKHIYCFLLFLCIGAVPVCAQTFNVKGQVINTELEKLSDVYLVLTTENDSTVIATAVTDKQGRFNISGNPDPRNGRAVLRLRHLAYKTRTYRYPVKLDTTMVVMLNHKTLSLKAAGVTASAPTLWYNSEGHMMVNLEKIPNYEVDNMGEALQKLPGVMVDPNLGILLFGDNARIQVDGMDLKMSADTYLRSMPAAMFAEVEIVPDATGRYGESGSVINFVTKRRKYSGHFSNVSVAGLYDDFSDKIGGEVGYFTMIKKENFYFNTSVKMETYPFESERRQDIRNVNTDRKRSFSSFHTERTYKPNNNTNISWDLSRGRKLAINTFLYYGTEDRKEKETQEYLSSPQSNRYSDYKDNPTGLIFSGNVQYQTSTKVSHKFSASYGYVINRVTSEQEDLVRNRDDVIVLDRVNDYKSTSQSHALKADWRHTIPKTALTIYGGTKIDMSLLSEDNSYEVKVSNNKYESSSFDANELIASVYTEAYYRINKKSNVRMGVRVAFTDYNIKNRTRNMDATHNFWNALPWLTFNYNITSDITTTFNLRSGISRPSYNNLMPGTVYYNNHEYRKGNSNLRPSKNYNLSIRNSFYDWIFITVRGTLGYDRIVGTIREDAEGLTEYSYDNAVDYRQINTNLSASQRFFNSKMTAQLNYNYTAGQYLRPKEGFNLPRGGRNYHNMSSNLYVNYNFSKRFSAWGRGTYMIDSKQMYNDYDPYVYFDLGMSHRFLKKRNLNISFTVKDIFDSHKYDYTRNYGDYVRHNHFKRSSRTFFLQAVFYFSGGFKFNREAGSDPNDKSRFE